MGHGDPEPMITIVTLILIALLLMQVFGYSHGLDVVDSITGFFFQPRVFFIYAFLLLAPMLFFKTFPGTLPMFIASFILYLALKAGLE